ncbi:para-aminobenzoate synthase [Pholiota conissans]|uniref:aminodeoxychorismate synthase n=1 Tax=Pholiota conissans TaxID=109636 RepID=A0A9P6D0G2_9AGAR|nr:para-aminobenzoate synthase [Pholiota conissans]
MTIGKPRLLLVDSYDSFTHNLAALCRRAIPNVSVTIIKNDELTIDELRRHLPYFSCIVVGPGPGSPDIAQDIGLVRDLWKLKEKEILPIFGVCLGLQSLAIENGAVLKRLHTVKHGLVSHIYHRSTQLFDSVGPIKAVRYHSLHVELKEDGDVEELAWANDEENGKIVMGVCHRHRPFWAVQYHPESACTDDGGIKVIANFWRLAQDWANVSGRRVVSWNIAITDNFGRPWPYSTLPPRSLSPTQPSGVVTEILKRVDLSAISISQTFGASDEKSNFALLESASQPGRYSIIGVISSSTLQITYRIGDTTVCLSKDGTTSFELLGSQDIWAWLSRFMRSKSVTDGNPELPFWGGLVGCMSYELGVHSMDVPVNRNTTNHSQHPDINLVFIERSVVVDAHTGRTFVQSILPDDSCWVLETATMLESLSPTSASTSTQAASGTSIVLPDKARYISKIQQAKEHLFAGDSYELCLTAQTRVSIPISSTSSSSTSWERYKYLRKSNPAPHSAYLRLHPTTLLSSSPERFLSYSRGPGSICQLRPIKGTVRKTPQITRAIAEQALVGSPKEVAENLMIVDLIRHDLHGVIGEDVAVKQFCSVEEYETVWQLVSVIEGKLSDGIKALPGVEDQVGWQVLRQCLPPGSMTGAPKKRSVEILQDLEDQERGIYSGVFGYWCVGGGGDWSVTIRSCFKYERPRDLCQNHAKTSEEWVIGAGGAITALSDPEGEWDEMVIKLQSVLRAFGAL